MSDEEKRAIEKVKEVIEIDKQRRIETIYDEKPLFRDQLQTLVDLIEKQQKLINTFISNEAVKEGKDFNEIKAKYYECL